MVTPAVRRAASTASVWAAGPTTPATDVKPRCWRCNHVLAWVVSQPWLIDCFRCGAHNSRGAGDLTLADFGVSPSTRRRRARPSRQ